jgi:hypothetical protein
MGSQRRYSAPLAVGIFSLIFASGLFLGRALERDPGRDEERNAEAEALRAELMTARRELEDEQKERGRLADELAGLLSWIDAIAGSQEEDGLEGWDGASRSEGPADSRGPETARGRGGSRPDFDVETLIAAGLSPQEAARLRDLWSEVEMKKAELGVRAASEGWPRTYRHFQAVRQIEEQIRADLEDDEYDLYLYASRRPNRLVIRDVVDGSPASRAGLQRGDRILSFDGRRVFAESDLEKFAASHGEQDNVRVQIVRDGRELSLVGPQASLGVLTAVTLEAPRFQ